MIGHPDYNSNVGRRQHRAALEAELERWFASHGADHWLERLVAAGVPCAPVHSIGDMLKDEQIRVNGIVDELPLAEGGTTPVVGPPIRLSDTPGSIRLHSPLLAADTRQVLGQFGYSEADMQRLVKAGVIRLG